MKLAWFLWYVVVAVQHLVFDNELLFEFHQDSMPFLQGFAVKYRYPGVGRKLDQCVENTEIMKRHPVKSQCPNNSCRFDMTNKRNQDCVLQTLSDNIILYETSGLYGESYLRVITDFKRADMGKTLRLHEKYFAEGVEIIKDTDTEVYLMIGTWKEQEFMLVRHDLVNDTLELVRTIPAGLNPIWGTLFQPETSTFHATTGDATLYRSKIDVDGIINGTVKYLQFQTGLPRTFTCNGQKIPMVNSIAYDRDTASMWGNVWFKEKIYQFNLETLKCQSLIDLSNNEYLSDYYVQQSTGNSNSVWNSIALLGHRWILFGGKQFDRTYVAKYTQ